MAASPPRDGEPPLEALRAGARAVGVALAPQQEELLVRYVALVFKWQRIQNLTGARSVADFAGRHLADCLTLLPYLRGSRVVDAGSGNGLPGVVLAIVRPELALTLVEARHKRARFLEQVRIELALPNLAVHCGRIDTWAPPVPPDTIVARAYGSLARLLADTRHLQQPGCRILAMKGQAPDAELAALGPLAGACTVERLEVPGWSARHLVVVDCAPLVPYSQPTRQP